MRKWYTPTRISNGENANALIKAERQKAITAGQGMVHLSDILTTQPVLYPFRPLVFRAMTIASQTRAGFFDCLYVALGEQEKCELVTADQRLITNLQSQFPFIKDLASFP